MQATILIEPFLEDGKNKFSMNTKGSYRTNLKQFFSQFQDDVEEIDEEDIQLYIAQMLELGRSPKTINQKLNTLRSFFGYVQDNREVLNITKPIDIEIETLTIQKQQFIENPLTRSDFNRMVRAAERAEDYRAIALFYTMFYTGARVSEALQLKAVDIGKESKIVKGKGKKFRTLFIPPKLKAHLDAYALRRGHGPKDYLFINVENNNPMSRREVWKITKEYGGQARIKLEKAKPHNIRHLLGYTLAAQGISIHRIAEILGHSDVNTSQIYTLTSKEEIVRIVQDAA